MIVPKQIAGLLSAVRICFPYQSNFKWVILLIGEDRGVLPVDGLEEKKKEMRPEAGFD